ncbi:hypothetical protein EAE96_007158 [Botrytis aclada]|nr:hypothetical protein EAE96_007158 [Botrytis aclada]
MDPLNATQAEGTDPFILIAEPEEGIAAVHLDRYYLLGDDVRMGLPITEELLARISHLSLEADYANRMRQDAQEIYDDYIPALEEQGGFMPTSLEKKNATRALLKPVERGTDELSPCFCKEPYADTTAKIDDHSHEPVKMPECPHIFGKCCIVQWLGDNSPSTCPMCRKVVHLPRDEPATRNGTDNGYSVIDYHY